MRASACIPAITAKALSCSGGVRTSSERSVTPDARAAACIARSRSPVAGLAGFPRTATREALGTASLSSCSCFAPNSAAIEDKPVTLPSGRARLEMNPEPTGSSAITTSGIVPVAFFRARADCVVSATMTAGLRLTSSSARASSDAPSPPAARFSKVMFL